MPGVRQPDVQASISRRRSFRREDITSSREQIPWSKTILSSARISLLWVIPERLRLSISRSLCSPIADAATSPGTPPWDRANPALLRDRIPPKIHGPLPGPMPGVDPPRSRTDDRTRETNQSRCRAAPWQLGFRFGEWLRRSESPHLIRPPDQGLHEQGNARRSGPCPSRLGRRQLSNRKRKAAGP